MENSFILVPIDFTDESMFTLQQSLNLAKATNSQIVLLHVIQNTSSFFDFLLKDKDNDISKKIETEITNKLKEIAEKFSKENNIKVQYILEHGKVYDKILEIAERFKVKSIVIGKSTKTSNNRFIGSNALTVIRESNIPVLTISYTDERILKNPDFKNAIHKGYKNILLPLDLTKETTQKTNIAIEIAKQHNANINVISVKTNDIDNTTQTKLLLQLDRVQQFISKQNIPCSSNFITKNDDESIAQTITEYAIKNKIDLIIIMTQQEKNWTKLFIGSTAQEIINISPVPVLSVIPKEE